MVFKVKNPVGSKIILDDQKLDQISHFNYLGCDISYNYYKDIDNKTVKYQMIC